MPRASRATINLQLAKEATENFFFLLRSLSSQADIALFYEDFFTEEEKTMFVKRLMVYLMLSKGYGGAEIALTLGMSRETIRLYKERSEQKGKEFSKLLQMVDRHQDSQQFWQKVERAIKPLDLVFRARSNMQARAKLIHRNEM